MKKSPFRRAIAALMLAALCTATLASAQRSDPANALLQSAIHKQVVDGDLKEAIKMYNEILSKYAGNRAVGAEALLHLGEAQEKLGIAEAKKTYQRIVLDYGAQPTVVLEAQARLRAMGEATVRSTSNGIVLSKIWTASPSADNTLMALSPDGRYLVEASNTGLLIHDVSSLEKDRYLRSLPSPSNGFPIAWPRFTPDGKRVVYVFAGKDGLHEIRAINTDGTDEQTIFKSIEYRQFELSAISPDGKLAAVAFIPASSTRSASNRSFWQIGLMSLQTGQLNILTSPGWRDTYTGNFSPDGRWFVYSSEVSGEGNDSAIYAIAVDGSVQHTLVAQPIRQQNFPFFSPDGSRVVSVFSPAGAKTDLISIPVADGKPLGPPEIVRENMPSGSISDVIGFTRDGALYLSENVSQNSIYVADVDASTWKLKSPSREISDPSRHEHVAEPAWSPNGKLLAFVDSANEKKLVIQEFNSRKERELSTHLNQMSFRGWLPDGKSVLLAGPPTGVRLFDTETQRERPLSLMITRPVISSSDGKYLFYFRGDDTRTVGQTQADSFIHLVRRDLQTGDEKELYRFEGWLPSVTMLAASPDGRNLSFAYAVASKPYSKTFWVLPLSGSEPRPRRLEGVGWEAGERVGSAWTQDAKAVLFVRSNEIWVQPVDGGQAYSTGIRMDGLDSLSVHPDGSRIAFVGHKSSNVVWKLQNLFPQVSTTK